MALIRNFDKINKDDVELAGGKGASLGEMSQAGIRVPPGFVVLSTAFEKFIVETGISADIDAKLHAVDHKTVSSVDNASEKIQAIIMGRDFPIDIAQEVLKYFDELDEKFVAVRSSATAEDSASAAWAGQLDTFLNTTEKNLCENIKKCWASLFTPRAIFYRFENGLHGDHISVAVVVQKMVDSEISGVAFSVHPVTQDRNQLIIEAGFGLGESIVSGQITPDSYVVEKDDFGILDINVSEQSKGLFRSPAGGNEWKNLGEEGEKQKLTGKQIIELAKLVVQIENHYGFPVDVEWAYEGGEMFITQSRPITTLG
jgi:pyruvate, water dikinase